MKIRSKYVSNSSSSSFIVNKDLTEFGISCLKLTRAQKELLNGSKIYDDEIIHFSNLDLDFYLTQFISDCSNKFDIITEMEGLECGQYASGELNEFPYREEDFNEYKMKYGESVFLRKEHDEAEQMTFSKFSRKFKKERGDMDVIVKYIDGGVELKFVE